MVTFGFAVVCLVLWAALELAHWGERVIESPEPLRITPEEKYQPVRVWVYPAIPAEPSEPSEVVERQLKSGEINLQEANERLRKLGWFNGN